MFADTGTYLSQAIHHYAGWDRPVFYSLFMLPLHATVTVWPVVVVQALLAAWVLWTVCRQLLPRISGMTFIVGVGLLSAFTWLPWIVSELMPDVFTPLLVLVLCLLGWMPERLTSWEQLIFAGLATFMIASQQSSLPLACVLLGAMSVRTLLAGRGLGELRPEGRQIGVDGASSTKVFLTRRKQGGHGSAMQKSSFDARPRNLVRLGRATRIMVVRPARRWLLIILPPALAVASLCAVNLLAHERFAVSPFGNIFLLARVIYDGPGMTTLRRDCPAAHWRLCPFLNDFPPTSDDFLWTQDSPLTRAGGPKIVSAEAGAIIRAALTADPGGEIRAGVSNTLEQLTRFESGDGLTPWPVEVSGEIERDFPATEFAAYASARQQRNALSVPAALTLVHEVIGLAGVILCAMLLPVAFKRRAPCAGFLFIVLLALPVSAAITGGLSTPHDRYQSRIMWLPPFVAVVAIVSLRRCPV